MKKKTTRPAKPANKATAAVPDWVIEDPCEIRYTLETFHANECDGFGQEIDLTREEFIALKAQLAKMRGYVVPKAA